jgi:hypothetical protein
MTGGASAWASVAEDITTADTQQIKSDRPTFSMSRLERVIRPSYLGVQAVERNLAFESG